MSQARASDTNRLLGYPDDARLLLVNADDFGMYDAINEAVVRAFRAGIVRSTSLMIPCPGASRAVQLLREDPGICCGVHLSVIRDIDHYHWGPLAPRNKVRSLLDESGLFYGSKRMPEMLERAKLDELEVEFRAQIEAVLAAGLRTTHVDWHCLLDGGRADVFDLTLGLALEYGLALRVMSRPHIEQVRRRGLPANDYDMWDSFSVSVEGKSDRYAQMLRDLPAGLSEWALHPSLGSAESQVVDPDGWRVRRTDFNFLISPRAREIIREEGIVLLDYESLQQVWRARPA